MVSKRVQVFRRPIFIQCFLFHVYIGGQAQTNCEFLDNEVVFSWKEIW